MFDGDLLDDDEFPGGIFFNEIDGGRSGLKQMFAGENIFT